MINADPLMEVVRREYAARTDRPRLRWVMDRPSYDRVRAATVTDGQERERASLHASALISVEKPPSRCPVCGEGPFAPAALSDHIRDQADPGNREPGPRDQLFGYPIEVRTDGGEPHLDDH